LIFVPLQSNLTDAELLELLNKDADQAIELLFRQYYGYVCKIIWQILPDMGAAEDLAQEVFFELWRRKNRLDVNISIRAYLRRAALNRTLNYLRDRKIKWEDDQALPQLESRTPEAQQLLEGTELQRVIDEAIAQLPEKCRIVFMLSRYDELSYQEIADQLSISVKTVENQISKALRQLRALLQPYLSSGLLFLFAFW
jgi:RNA polymerase sigma-70 factor (ECF subfamily)